MPPTTPAIGVFGTFDVDNYGDLLFPRILQRALDRRLPDAEIALFSPRPGHFDAAWCSGVSAVDEIARRFPSGADAYVVGGGDLIRTDLAPGTFPGYRGTFSPFVMLWLAPALLAAESGRPVCWNAVGVPYEFSAEDVPLVRDACRLTAYLSVRDQRSKAFLRAAGVAQDIDVVPDTGLLVTELFTEQELSDTWLALVGQPLEPGLRTLCFHASPAFLEDELTVVAEQLRALLDTGFARVVLLPICNLLGDHLALIKLQELLGPRALVIDRPTRPHEVAACIAGCDAFIGTSLHGCITALAFHKPYVALARLQKLRSHFVDLGQDDRAFNQWSDLARRAPLLGPEYRLELAETGAGLRARIERHFDRIAESIALRTPKAQTKELAWGLLGPELTREQDALRRLQRWTLASYQRHAEAAMEQTESLRAELRQTRATALENAAGIERLKRDLAAEQDAHERQQNAYLQHIAELQADQRRLHSLIEELRCKQLPDWALRVRRQWRRLAG